MKILIAPDKFKGSLTASEACNAIAKGLRQQRSDLDIRLIPIADGGEGTRASWMALTGGLEERVEVLDPLFRPIEARYSLSADGETAFIEMAEASGLQLLAPSERNPMRTTSFGTGQLIAAALDRGVKNILLAIGGSATNDMGIGMANALGFVFLAEDLTELNPIGQNLSSIHHIVPRFLHPRLTEVSITVLCDVGNTLYGPNGAAYVYGAQKGGRPQDLEQLDAGLRHLAALIQQMNGTNVNFPGAGAAGGMGAGTRFFLHASLQKGVEVISQLARLDDAIRDADWVITGEGRLDPSSFTGKVVGHVLNRSAEFGKPVSVICGSSLLKEKECQAKGISELKTLTSDHDIEMATRLAKELVEKKAGELNLSIDLHAKG